MGRSVLSAYMYVHHMHAWWLERYGWIHTRLWAATLWVLWEAAGALSCWVISSAMGIFLDRLYFRYGIVWIPHCPQTPTRLCLLSAVIHWLWTSLLAWCNPFIYFCFCFLWFEVIYNKSLHSQTTLSNSPLFSSNISWFCVLLLLSWFGDIVKDMV